MKEVKKEFDITGFTSFREVSSQYSDSFIKENLCIKLSEDDKEVSVCMVNADERKKAELSNYHYPKKLIIIKAEEKDFVQFIGTILENTAEEIKEEKTDDFTPYTENLSVTDVEVTESAVNIVNGICIRALREKASDIHIHRINSKADVRFRINGVLQSVQSFNGGIYETVISRIKIMAGLNIAEKRLPQDGRISARFGTERFDSRVSVIPTGEGEAVVMRLFGSSTEELGLSELGFTEDVRSVLDKVIKLKSGLVVITGPTGSGKNTTLYALLKQMDRERLKIISIEDPVERVIEGVDQIEINEEIGLTFSCVLRRILRQDPDVIMVGEIRDDDTAELCIRASLTGHLVLTTLHTEDSISTVSRLEDQGVKPYLIASTLKVCMAQRLVRRKQTDGKSGRTAVGEVFETDDRIRALIAEGRSENSVREYLYKNSFRSLSCNAQKLLKRELVTKESLLEEGLL